MPRALSLSERTALPMWQEENRALFAQCLNGLAADPYVKQMQPIRQHAENVSCYDHCLFVSYLAFTLCRKTGLDYRVAARGGLLHDLYLQNWEETDVNPLRRLWLHPHMALANARRFGLSPRRRTSSRAICGPWAARCPSWEERDGQPGRQGRRNGGDAASGASAGRTEKSGAAEAGVNIRVNKTKKGRSGILPGRPLRIGSVFYYPL